MSWRCNDCGELNDDIHPECWKCVERNGAKQTAQPYKVKSGKVIQCSTTIEIPGREISSSVGVVFGEAILGTNVFKDVLAGIRDVVGGRSGTYENNLREGRAIAMREMLEEADGLGADAVVGIDVDYETVAQTMLMICFSGTAVSLKSEP